VQWCQNGDFLHPVFPVSRVQHISDLHSKFALRPHHVSKYGRHPICGRWDKARKKRRKKLECGPMPNVMAALSNIGGALYSTPQFGWRPLLECCALTLPRCETCWNLQGCPKLANRSQPLVCWSSPYYEDMWRRCRGLTSYFPIVDTCLSCENSARESHAMEPKWFFCVLYFQQATCSTFQTCILNSH